MVQGEPRRGVLTLGSHPASARRWLHELGRCPRVSEGLSAVGRVLLCQSLPVLDSLFSPPLPYSIPCLPEPPEPAWETEWGLQDQQREPPPSRLYLLLPLCNRGLVHPLMIHHVQPGAAWQLPKAESRPGEKGHLSPGAGAAEAKLSARLLRPWLPGHGQHELVAWRHLLELCTRAWPSREGPWRAVAICPHTAPFQRGIILQVITHSLKNACRGTLRRQLLSLCAANDLRCRLIPLGLSLLICKTGLRVLPMEMVRGKVRERPLKSAKGYYQHVALGACGRGAKGALGMRARSTEGCCKDGSSVGRDSEAWPAGGWREAERALSSSPGPSSDISGR